MAGHVVGPSFFTFAIGMVLVDKLINAVFDAKVAFVVLAFVFVSNVLLALEKWWQERVRCVFRL